jgi:PAS domain S-box-containing protein
MSVDEVTNLLDFEKSSIASEMAALEDFSSVIIQASMDGILTYDLESRYTLWSPSMERLTGILSKDILGRNAYEVFPFMKEVGLDKLYEASLRGEAMRAPVSRFFVPETGATGYTEQQNFPLVDELGNVTGGLAIVRDVTAMKNKFDELSQRNRDLEAKVSELEFQLKARLSS